MARRCPIRGPLKKGGRYKKEERKKLLLKNQLRAHVPGERSNDGGAARGIIMHGVACRMRFCLTQFCGLQFVPRGKGFKYIEAQDGGGRS